MRKALNRLVRVQVLISETEREAFRVEAEREGQSLSGWLRERGLEGLDARSSRKKIGSVAELKKFFAACDRREKGRGEEPDWKEHLRVIDASRAAGQADT
jgi:hypothetical protein